MNYFKDPVFKSGDIVKCLSAHNYYSFREGKEYLVVGYIPSYYNPIYTWPAMVRIRDDNENITHCHARKFELVKESSQESDGTPEEVGS